MNVLMLKYCAVNGVIAALLAGCGGPNASTTTAMTATAQDTGRHATSSSGDLLYVENGLTQRLEVLSYPSMSLLTTLPYMYALGASNPDNGEMCFVADADSAADIWAHGGLKPSTSLYITKGFPYDCAFDPTSNAVAVSMSAVGSNGPILAVFPNSSSSPQYYSYPKIGNALFLAYDNNGNLFLDSRSYKNTLFFWLPKGSANLVQFTIQADEKLFPVGSLQFDGTYMTVHHGPDLYRITVSGTQATVVGTTTLRKTWPRFLEYVIAGNVAIGGSILGTIGPGHPKRQELGFWNYPDGGAPTEQMELNHSHKTRIGAIVLSVVPGRSRIHN
jgi:hypothetical protein